MQGTTAAGFWSLSSNCNDCKAARSWGAWEGTPFSVKFLALVRFDDLCFGKERVAGRSDWAVHFPNVCRLTPVSVVTVFQRWFSLSGGKYCEEIYQSCRSIPEGRKWPNRS